MKDFRESAAFARLVAVFVERANGQGWSIDGARAGVLLGDRIARVATLARRTPSAVLRDYGARDVIAFVDVSIRARTEAGGNNDRAGAPAVAVPGRLIAGLTSDLASAAQLAAHNGDLDTVNLAADALRGLARAFQDGHVEASVSAEALHLTRQVLVRARRGIGTGWRLRVNAAPARVAALVDSMDGAFNDDVGEITMVLETLA